MSKVAIRRGRQPCPVKDCGGRHHCDCGLPISHTMRQCRWCPEKETAEHA